VSVIQRKRTLARGTPQGSSAPPSATAKRPPTRYLNERPNRANNFGSTREASRAWYRFKSVGPKGKKIGLRYNSRYRAPLEVGVVVKVVGHSLGRGVASLSTPIES